ncbi:uncharacterized protein DS421_9g257970 [Arachis hypogaea]|nr:uncharacterized protein DS421_9g257970 [Arachis hypogaea]
MWTNNLNLNAQFSWMPYSLAEVVQVVHPEILEPRHMTLWRAATALIYFAVIEWHPVDRVLPQFGGVQGRPRAALNIDFLMSKDERGGDCWFPLSLQSWHIHWSDRVQHVLQFDIVPDPGPSHEYLDWWYQHGRRFLSPELILGDPRATAIPAQAIERGPGHPVCFRGWQFITGCSVYIACCHARCRSLGRGR